VGSSEGKEEEPSSQKERGYKNGKSLHKLHRVRAISIHRKGEGLSERAFF